MYCELGLNNGGITDSMSREEDAVKVLQEQIVQLKLALQAKDSEITRLNTQMGTEHVVIAKMVIDGFYHIFHAARGADPGVPIQMAAGVKNDIERTLNEIDAYLRTRKLVVMEGGKTVQ